MATRTHKVIDTCNFGGDYPNQKEIVLKNSEGVISPVFLTEEDANALADLLNLAQGNGVNSTRYYKAVKATHQLAPGFQP